MKRAGLIVVLLWSIAPAVRADGPADALPEALLPFKPLADRCRQWHARDRNPRWKLVHDERFGENPDRWAQASKHAKLGSYAGKPELRVVPPTGGTAFVPIGPKVKGEFAIEMIAQSLTDQVVPLSIMLDEPRGAGPGFQFGTRHDGKHILWVAGDAPNAADSAFTARMVDDTLKQTPKRFYKVRLEVRRDGITGYVDGIKIASSPIHGPYDWDKLRQPMAMTVVAPIGITLFRIETYAPSEGEAQQASDAETWQKVFGETTRQRVEAEAAKLVMMLDHDAWVVREKAGGLIRDVGAFAVPALRDAVKADSAELNLRAEALLNAIAPAPAAAGQATQGPTPPSPIGPPPVLPVQIQLQQLQQIQVQIGCDG